MSQRVNSCFGSLLSCFVVSLLFAVNAAAVVELDIEVEFSQDSTSVYVKATKELSNVVLEFCDNTDPFKFDELSGYEGTFSKDGKTLSGVYVKSGEAPEGPEGRGRYFPNENGCPTPTATPTATSSPTATPTATATPTVTPLPEPTATATPTPTATTVPTVEPSSTPTPTPSGELVEICLVSDDPELNGTKITVPVEQLEQYDPGTYQLVDLCGVCGGDNSSCLDCRGVPNGGAELDLCGVCEGDNSSCLDCLGMPNGGAVLDQCGVCGGDGSSCVEISDCKGGYDQCGVCEGKNECLDCAGIPFGKTEIDCCGVCGGDGSTCLDQCEIFPVKKYKAVSFRNMRSLRASVRKYSRRQRACGGSRKVVRSRIAWANRIMEKNRQLMSSFVGDTIKVCQTEFCTKTNFESVLKVAKRNARLMLRLSRQAQRGAIKACKSKKSKTPSRRTAQKNFSHAVAAIGKIPGQACD